MAKKTVSKGKKTAAKKKPAPQKAKASAKKANSKNTPVEKAANSELREKMLQTLEESGKPQMHLDDIVKATGAPVGDVSATLMILELERKVKSLPGKFFRSSGLDAQLREQRGKKAAAKSAASERDSARRGGKPHGKMSILDAAVEVLKGSSEPLATKELVRLVFEKGLAQSSGRTPHATLSAAMGREIKTKGAQSRFRRTDRGLYALNA